MSSVNTIVLATVLFFSAFSPAYVNPASHFHSEQEAKQHCPNDTVVWVNTKTGVYHFKGERWYGATKEGFTNAAKRQILQATAQPETASEAMQRKNGVNLRSELPSASGIGRPSSYQNPRAHEDAGTRTDLSGPVLLYLQ